MSDSKRNVHIEFNRSRTPRVLVDGIRMKGVVGVGIDGGDRSTPIWTIRLHSDFVTAGPADRDETADPVEPASDG